MPIRCTEEKEDRKYYEDEGESMVDNIEGWGKTARFIMSSVIIIIMTVVHEEF